MRSCYEVLGTSSEADRSQLKSAFRNLAKTFHPDLHGGDPRAQERFKEINRAYQVLRDPRTRTAHDAFLAEKRSGARRRTRNAAATMFATFLLSGAFCVALMIWLQGGRFPLARDHETARLAEKATVAPSPRFVSGTDGASDHESGPARLAGASPAEGSGVVLTSDAQEASPGVVQTASNRSDRTRWIMYQRYRAKVALSVPQGVGPRRHGNDSTSAAAYAGGTRSS